MVLEDDDFTVDYESPEEEPTYADEEEPEPPMEEMRDIEESDGEDDQVNGYSNSDTEEDPMLYSEVDENSVEALEVWRDASRSFPPLELPKSSLDLLIPPGPLLADVFSIYEALRYFTQPLKLTPFRIEDLCACLVAKEHSNLFSAIFCALLKILFKSDEQISIQYGPADMRDGAAIYTSFLDHMTWPQTLKVYAASDPEHFRNRSYFSVLRLLHNMCQS